MALPFGDPQAELLRVADRLWGADSTPLPDAGQIDIEFGYGAEAENFGAEIRRFFEETITAEMRSEAAPQRTDMTGGCSASSPRQGCSIPTGGGIRRPGAKRL